MKTCNPYWIFCSSNPTTALSKTFSNQDALIVDADEPEPIEKNTYPAVDDGVLR